MTLSQEKRNNKLELINKAKNNYQDDDYYDENNN